MTARKTCHIILVLCSLAGVARGQSENQAPTLELKDIQGRSLRLSDYKGKVVLVNFWATWCVPCRTEIPELIKKQKTYGPKGLRIIGITYPPEKRFDVLRFMNKMRINYRVAPGTKATKSVFTSSETLPLTVVIDRDGLVRDLIEGIMYEDEFDQKVKPLLSLSSRTSRKESP
jgi:thiol-disulfide isomerase/thioredoxin